METNLPDAYALLLARLMAVEADMSALRERVAELEAGGCDGQRTRAVEQLSGLKEHG